MAAGGRCALAVAAVGDPQTAHAASTVAGTMKMPIESIARRLKAPRTTTVAIAIRRAARLCSRRLSATQTTSAEQRGHGHRDEDPGPVDVDERGARVNAGGGGVRALAAVDGREEGDRDQRERPRERGGREAEAAPLARIIARHPPSVAPSRPPRGRGAVRRRRTGISGPRCAGLLTLESAAARSSRPAVAARR